MREGTEGRGVREGDVRGWRAWLAWHGQAVQLPPGALVLPGVWPQASGAHMLMNIGSEFTHMSIT